MQSPDRTWNLARLHGSQKPAGTTRTFKNFKLYVYEGLLVYMHTTWLPGTCGSQKSVSDSLERELARWL